MHGLTGGSWKRHTDRTRATEMKDTRGNLAVTSGSETYRRCALPRQLSTLLPRRNRHKRPILAATTQGQQLDDALSGGTMYNAANVEQLKDVYADAAGAVRLRNHPR